MRYEGIPPSIYMCVICVPPYVGTLLLSLAVRSPMQACFLSSSIYVASLILSTFLYRVSPFHPLAQHPGPIRCKLSKFWMAWIGLTGRQHTYIRSLHERYGDVVRIGPNEVSIRDPTATHALLGPAGLPHGPMFIGKFIRPDPTDMPIVGLIDTAAHLERRKPWARAFNGASLKEYVPMMATRAVQLVQTLQHEQGAIDIGKWVNFFSYDFMCDMAFGGGSELLRDGDADNFWGLVERGLPPGTFLSHVPWLASYLVHIPFITADIRKILGYCTDLTAKRIARGTSNKDLFHYLSNEDQPEQEPPSMKRIVDEGIVAMVAGADTTSSALTSILFSLVTHSDAYSRLEEEIDRFYPAGQDPCQTKYHRDMPYLTAVINEAMRIFPPIPSGGQRQVLHSSSGVSVGSIFLPPGTVVWLHTYSIHRDARNFAPHPEDFWPERWLVAAGLMTESEAGLSDKTGFTHNAAAFAPFSYGPMNCVGKNLAMLEMGLVICTILQKFKLRPAEEWDPRVYEGGFKDFFVTTRPPVFVTLHPRC
ncbi:high nitrogen upregulated cytochrome P450 monooxygenase 2 [Trametes meyenii]|nr:high nitrogen upregulated cytochrome P450 monooxygenase 2 [Trametes meyenii]